MTTSRSQPSTRETRNAARDDQAGPRQGACRGHARAGPPRAGMGVPVRGGQPAGRDVRVDLGRREVLVAQQLLDDTQVGATVEQVRRERVAQRVGRHAERAGRPRGTAGRAGSAARGRPSGPPAWLRKTAVGAGASGLRRRGVTLGQERAAVVEVGGQRGDRRAARAGRSAPCDPCRSPGSRHGAGRASRGRPRRAR